MTLLISDETVSVDTLTPHPVNYRSHPQDQIDHLAASIEQLGVYRSVVISSDDFVLAGHGVLQAAKQINLAEIICKRMPFTHDDPRALKLLTADNTLSLFALDDDRRLTELLRRISEEDTLHGTGYNDNNLAALAMVTRPASEISDIDAAAEWAGAGMPDFETDDQRHVLIHVFDSEDDRERYVRDQQIPTDSIRRGTTKWSVRWPYAGADDVRNVFWQPNSTTADEWMQLTRAQLVEHARTRSLPTSGTKSAIAERLAEHELQAAS